jgi:class 3 adenylate cyclase
MATDVTKNIDELIAARTLKKAELRETGIRIASASTPVVVAFVDLAESTRMKQEFEPEEWLGFVFEFIRCVDELVSVANGTVVKRSVMGSCSVPATNIHVEQSMGRARIASPGGAAITF